MHRRTQGPSAGRPSDLQTRTFAPRGHPRFALFGEKTIKQVVNDAKTTPAYAEMNKRKLSTIIPGVYGKPVILFERFRETKLVPNCVTVNYGGAFCVI